MSKPWKKTAKAPHQKREKHEKLDADQLDRQLENYWGKNKDGDNFKNFQENKKIGLDNDLDSYWANKEKPVEESKLLFLG